MSDQAKSYMNIRQAAFIGVGAMVGAGIFSLLGAAGEVAGSAVWLSFVIAGAIAGLQGYSFAKLGAKYPSSAGLLEYVSQGFGPGHFTRVTAWLTYAVNAVITAMVASSFGSYASAAFAGGSAAWAKVFAVLIILAMTGLNIVGSKVVARAQTVIVVVVIGILTLFSVATLLNINPQLLAPSGYPPLRDIVSSVALTFFAFLGFGIVTFTAKDLKEPSRELPKAMYLALGIATVVVRCGLARGVRHLDGEAGHRVRRNGDRGRRRARAWQSRILADERDGAVRDLRGHQRGALSRGGPVRPAGQDRAVPARDGAQDRRPSVRRALCSSPSAAPCWCWASTSTRSLPSEAPSP